MNVTIKRSMAIVTAGVWCWMGTMLVAQSAPVTSTGAAPVAVHSVELDRLVAVVNQDVILESDVDQERRMAAFQPFRDTRLISTRDQVIERLIDRLLILQQLRLEAEEEITDKQIEEQLSALRKDIPQCELYHCDTNAGWEKFVAAQGFTIPELIRVWRERMEVLNFVEVRFRSGIQISDDEVHTYYEKTLLPQYLKQKAVAPPEEAIAKRIREVLLQQQVVDLLGDWLKSLRAQGTVRTIEPGEATP
jgi:peptidyl-prolyl cis-trans isomerase SurA